MEAVKPPFALIHIPRTGGSTLRLSLKRKLGRDKMLWVKTHSTDFSAIASQIEPQTRMIFGHMNYGLHDKVPVRYVTVLRNPIDRTISHYRLHIQQRARRGLGPVSWPAFLAKDEGSNLQCRILAGTWRTGKILDDEELLERAQRNLASAYRVFFQERYNDVLSFFRLYPANRINGDGPSVEIDNEALTAIEAANQLDIKLYQNAGTSKIYHAGM